jgi:hypothetical protein
MDAVRTSETSVYIYETTLRYVPEGYHILSHYSLCFLKSWLSVG